MILQDLQSALLLKHFKICLLIFLRYLSTRQSPTCQLVGWYNTIKLCRCHKNRLHNLAMCSLQALCSVNCLPLSCSCDAFFFFEVLLLRRHSLTLCNSCYICFMYLCISLLIRVDVASNWLACFPVSLKKHVYDIFFIQGLTSEVVQALIPCLQPKGSDRFDVDVASSNAERYL